jgi:GT2 family glycosyltransferase
MDWEAMRDTTLLIKSFQRPRCMKRQLQTLRKFWPDTPVVVADDSEPPVQRAIAQMAQYYLGDRLTFVRLPFDVGVSTGRNRLVDTAQTPYVVLLEDDFVFTAETRLEELVGHIRADTYDLVSGTVVLVHETQVQHYEGYITLRADTLYLAPLEHYEHHQQCDVVTNFFAARTDIVRAVRWDEELKLSEHLDYFMRCQQYGVRVGYEPTVKILHTRERPSGYQSYRRRSFDYHQVWLGKWGIREIRGAIEPDACYVLKPETRMLLFPGRCS